MEFHQAIQNRAGQTVAVTNKYVPTLTVSGVTSAGLLAQSQALDPLAQKRDNAQAAAGAAANAEHLGYAAIRALDFSLPPAAEGELSDTIPAESALLDLLTPVYGVDPRTTELALKRGQKLVAALTSINTYLAGRTPPRGPVTSGGKGVADLSALIDAQPALEQAVEDRAADLTGGRNGLHTAAVGVDRLNKHFYTKLQSEGRTNPALADALKQIDTGTGNLPATLGVKSVLQGGTDHLHILLSYDPASYVGTDTNTVEWQVVSVDADFKNHSVAVDPSGNALGPFAVGQTVNLRTRVTSNTGTTLGSVRTLTLAAP
jgi:hypothetical protein